MFNRFIKQSFFLGAILAISMPMARAEDGNQINSPNAPDSTNSPAGIAIKMKVAEELAQRFPGARIELSLLNIPSQPRVEAVNLTHVNARGEFRANVKMGSEEGNSSLEEVAGTFSAWVQTPVAVRRVAPGQRIEPEAFRIQSVNVAQGLAHEFRGILLPPSQDFSGIEARQTILEGQFITATAVQKMPNVRRGDLLQIEISAGGLVVSTQATAQEPGFLDQNIRVMTTKTKRELVGQLRANNRVEVKL